MGELTERRRLCGSRGALQIPRLRSRDDKSRVVTFIRGRQIGWTEKKQQAPPLRFGPPASRGRRDDNHVKINKVTASQDDNFAGVLTKNILNELALMGRRSWDILGRAWRDY